MENTNVVLNNEVEVAEVADVEVASTGLSVKHAAIAAGIVGGVIGLVVLYKKVLKPAIAKAKAKKAAEQEEAAE